MGVAAPGEPLDANAQGLHRAHLSPLRHDGEHLHARIRNQGHLAVVHPDEAVDIGLHLVGDYVLQQRLVSLEADELHCILLPLNRQDLVIRREFDGTDGPASVVHAKGYDGVLGGTGSLHNHPCGPAGSNRKDLQLGMRISVT